jgi:hypothetical protein
VGIAALIKGEKTMKAIVLIAVFCALTGSVFSGQSIDDVTLKRYLTQNFIADESMRWEKIDGFKERFAVADDQLHRVLMIIYREAEDNRLTLTPKTREWNNNNRTIEGVLGWLPKCGDIPVKEFLMSYATTKENDSWLRRAAILSYLRLADPGEAKNALLRFLVEEDRMDNMARLGLYSYARTVYDAASPEKQAAILAALIASANKEEGKIEFMKVDKILAERSAAYRYSRERLVMLERHSLEPPTTNLYTDRDLKAALEACRNYKAHTSVTTNLADLKSWDSKMLQSGLLDTNLAAAVYEGPDKGAQSPNATKRGSSIIIIAGAALLLLLGFCIWMFARK